MSYQTGVNEDESRLRNTNTEITFLENVPNDVKYQPSSLNSSFEESSNANNNYITFKTQEENRTLMTSLESESISRVNKKAQCQIDLDSVRSSSSNIPKVFYFLFSDIRSFTFFMCLIVMLTNALTVGYRNSVITTIEKRFEFSSMSSGVLSGFLEVGSLITTLIMSYFFSNSHIPKCIAFSSLVCAIGSIMYTLPHFLSNLHIANSLSKNQTNNDFLCKYGNINDLKNQYEIETVKQNPGPVISFLDKFDIKTHCLLKPNNVGTFLILSIANILIGSSSAPLYTLGTTYIDNHVDKDNSSVYLAFIYSMLAFGPLVGYLAGAGFLQIYVDSFRQSIKDLNITPSDPNWIGAWYFGFIVFGVLIFFTSFMFFMFPKKMNKIDDINIDCSIAKNELKDDSFGELKNLPKAMKNLLINRVFMIVSLAFCFEITIISGFMTFLPKYLEHQFSLNNSIANIYTGGIAIPGAIVGIVTGGFFVKKFKINPKGASLMAISCNILCLGGIFVLIFIGCPNIKMAGTTASYSNSILDNRKIEIEKFKLTSECNKNCDCSTSSIEPICGRNQITYFSPCFAGCSKYINSETKSFFSCKCIQNDIFNNQSDLTDSIPDAHSGSCTFDCKALLPFLAILFFITLLTSLNQMPMLMVTLRSVSEVERPFALGLQLVIMRLLAYIPSPLIFGQAIDFTCLIWRKDECDKTGSCLLYDREKFRYVYGSIAWVYKAFSLVFFILLYLSVKKFTYKQKPIEIVTIFRASVNSLNNCPQLKQDSINELENLTAK